MPWSGIFLLAKDFMQQIAGAAKPVRKRNTNLRNPQDLPPILHNGRSFMTHSALTNRESAITSFTRRQIILITALVVIATALGLYHIQYLFTGFIALVTAFYFLDLMFNFFLVSRSLSRNTEIVITPEQLSLERSAYPKYTILCPLYDEANVLSQFVDAMMKLDYPKKNLQILLLL